MKQWILIGLLVLALIGTVIYHLKTRSDLNDQNDRLNEQLMQANLEIGKAHTQFGDASSKIKELEGNLQEQLNKNKELVVAYGELRAKYNAKGGGTTTVVTVPGPAIEMPEELKLEPNNFYLAVSENELAFIGEKLGATWSDYRLWLDANFTYSESENLQLKIDYKLDFKLGGQLVQTTTPSGAVNHYLNLWELDDKGNKVGKFELQSFEVTTQDQRASHFMAWAPHLDLGVLGGYNEGLQLGASVGFSFMGYGKTENDLTWRFIRPGLTLSDRFGLDLAPVLYNVGDPLPLVSNLWIGPYASWTLPKGFGGGLMLNLVL